MRGNIWPNRPEIRGMSVKATSYCRRCRRRDNRQTYASHLVSVRHPYRLSYAIRRTRISARLAAQSNQERDRTQQSPAISAAADFGAALLSPPTDRRRLHRETTSGAGGDVIAPGRGGNGWPSSAADRCFATLSA